MKNAGVQLLILSCLIIIIIGPLKGSYAADDTEFTLPSQWILFQYGDQTVPLYEGDITAKLLDLCLTPSGQDAKTCNEIANPALNESCIIQCSTERLEALHLVKEKVRGLISSLQDPIKTIVMWVILLLCIAGGIFLILKGHYQWVNLPLIGNWLMDDPTNGIKFKHYLWMRWIILGNSNIHWKTYMKDDAFVYNWTSLTTQPWNRPSTPPEIKQNELSDRPSWNIEDIVREKGLKIGDTEKHGDLSEGWEKVVRDKRQTRRKSKTKKTSKGEEGGGGGAGVESTMEKPLPAAKTKPTPKNKVDKKKGDDSKRKDSNNEARENALYQEVLDEYWERIYEWSWHRYRNISEEMRNESVGKKEVVHTEDEIESIVTDNADNVSRADILMNDVNE